jgi:hypothetical protein
MHSWKKMLFLIRTSLELFRPDIESSIIHIFRLAHTVTTLTLRECEKEVSLHTFDRDDPSLIILDSIIRAAYHIGLSGTREDRLRRRDFHVPKWLSTSRAIRRASRCYWRSRQGDLSTYPDGYCRVWTRSIRHFVRPSTGYEDEERCEDEYA